MGRPTISSTQVPPLPWPTWSCCQSFHLLACLNAFDLTAFGFGRCDVISCQPRFFEHPRRMLFGAYRPRQRGSDAFRSLPPEAAMILKILSSKRIVRLIR